MEDEELDASTVSSEAKQEHDTLVFTAKRLMRKIMNHVLMARENDEVEKEKLANININAAKPMIDSVHEEEEKRQCVDDEYDEAYDVFKDLPRDVQEEIIGRLPSQVEGISSVEKPLPLPLPLPISENEEEEQDCSYSRHKCFVELFNQLPSDNHFRHTFVTKYGCADRATANKPKNIDLYGRVRLQVHPADHASSFNNDKFKVLTFDIRGGGGEDQGGSSQGQGGSSSHGSSTKHNNLHLNYPSI